MSSDFSFNYKRIILDKEAQAISDANWDRAFPPKSKKEVDEDE